MSSRFKVKYGLFEIEYEGELSFAQDELIAATRDIVDIVRANGDDLLSDSATGNTKDVNLAKNIHGIIKGTSSTYASRLKVSSGPELARAAAASLTFSDGKSTFTRKNLIDEMRSASAYFKQTYINNLSSTINRLVKDGVLFEVSKDEYSLSASAQDELIKQLN